MGREGYGERGPDEEVREGRRVRDGGKGWGSGVQGRSGVMMGVRKIAQAVHCLQVSKSVHVGLCFSVSVVSLKLKLTQFIR